jgi:hypothetical protein
VPLKLPSSRFTVETAATQGVYNKVKARKLIADNGVNNVCKVFPSSATFDPVNTAKVLITASFAIKPVMSAVEIRQSENPTGTNMPLIKRPIRTSMLSVPSGT